MLVYSREATSVLLPPRTRSVGSGSVLLRKDIHQSQVASVAASGSETTSAEPLATQLYDELCGIARRLLRSERAGHTLDTTAIVHEAFLRLAQQHAAEWKDREHFLSAAARTMRHVLVDYARDRLAVKRDGGVRTTLISVPDAKGLSADTLDVLALDDVLSRLAELDARQAQVVELRVFGGFDVVEIASVLGISPRTVKRDWQFAKAWLACELAPED